jgi:hypothetical protein
MLVAVERGKREGIGYIRGDGRGAAAVHQVDSRAAAVNTNNGEYRSVNCVLGSAEGGCARARPRSPP